MATKFEFKKSLSGGAERKLLCGAETVIANSVELKVEDAVKWDTDGFIALATAGDKVLGIVEGVVDKDGIAIEPDADTLNTYTMASDNETAAAKMKRASIDISKNSLYKNDASGDLTRTMIGQLFDLTDEDQIDQGTASDTSGQFQLIRLDPDNESDASMGLFKIAESQLDPFTQD